MNLGNTIYIEDNFTNKIQGISVNDEYLFIKMIQPILKYYYHDFNNNFDLKNELNKSIKLRHAYFDVSKTESLEQNLNNLIELRYNDSNLFQFQSVQDHQVKLYDIINHRNLNVSYNDYTFNDIHKEIYLYLKKFFSYNDSKKSNKNFTYVLFISKIANCYRSSKDDDIRTILIDKSHLINDLYQSTMDRSIFNSVPGNKDSIKMITLNNCIKKLLLNLKTNDGKFIFNNSYLDYGDYLIHLEEELGQLSYLSDFCDLRKENTFLNDINERSNSIIKLIDKMNKIHNDKNNPFNEIKDIMTYNIYQIKEIIQHK